MRLCEPFVRRGGCDVVFHIDLSHGGAIVKSFGSDAIQGLLVNIYSKDGTADSGVLKAAHACREAFNEPVWQKGEGRAAFSFLYCAGSFPAFFRSF